MDPAPTRGDPRSREHRRSTVLLVEDEALVRLALAEALRDAGAVVVEAGSADVALVHQHLKHALAQLVTDVRMPGSLDGLQLALRLQEMMTAGRVIVASGHIDPGDTRLAGFVFIPKPYEISSTVQLIEQLLVMEEPRGRLHCDP